MINVKDDVHLLFYNVFGVAIIREDKITVSVNAYKNGGIRGRVLEHELDTQLVRLERVDKPVLLPFAAWVTEDKILFSPGRMTDYDAEMYVINKDVIEPIIKSAIGLIRGALLDRS